MAWPLHCYPVNNMLLYLHKKITFIPISIVPLISLSSKNYASLLNAAAKNKRLLSSFVAAQHHNTIAVKTSTAAHKRSKQINPERPQCERGLWYQTQFVLAVLG